MTLKDSLNWHEARVNPRKPTKLHRWTWDGRPKYLAISLDLGEVSSSVHCDPEARRTITVKRAMKIMRFVQLVRKLQGQELPVFNRRHGNKVYSYRISPMALAAKKMSTSLRDLMPTADDKAEVQELIADWSMTPDKRASVARAAQNKLLMEAVNSDKVKDRKFALEVIKSIAKDVQVGMESSGPGQLGEAIGAGLRSILADVEIPKELAASTSNDNVVIDAEFTEVPKESS